MPSFTMGLANGEHLTVEVQNWARPVHRHHDWVVAEVAIQAGGFVGRFGAEFLVRDFTHLHRDLSRLYHDLSGDMKFETLEGQLAFEMSGDGRGSFEANCIARDKAGNHLQFCLNLDQTFIPLMLQELQAITAQYPA
jgi:hypothetical protein